jgi:GH24 family phage-related lysozyme (muramidase)
MAHDRISRSSRPQQRVTTAPSVRGVAATAPNSAVRVPDTIGTLQRSLSGFFSAGQKGIEFLMEDELRDEIEKAHRENEVLDKQARVDATTREAPDPLFTDRKAYIDTFRIARGAEMFARDEDALKERLWEHDPANGDPWDVFKSFMDEKIKNADPFVGASYREKALASFSTEVGKWYTRQKTIATDSGIRAVDEEHSWLLSNGYAFNSAEDYDRLVSQYRNILPAERKNEAHQYATKFLFEKAPYTNNASVLGLLDQKLGNGRTLREMYPDQAAKVEQAYVERWNATRSLAAEKDLDEIKMGLTEAENGIGGNLNELAYRLVRHSELYGYSEKYNEQFTRVAKMLGGEAAFKRFAEQAKAIEGGAKLAPASQEDWNKYGNRLVDQVARERGWGAAWSLIATNGVVPDRVKALGTQMVAPAAGSRAQTYELFKGLAAVNRPGLLKQALGEKGVQVFEGMQMLVESGVPVEQAAERSLAWNIEDPKGFENFPIGDNKPETVRSQVGKVAEMIRKGIPGAEGDVLPEVLGGQPGLRVDPSLEQKITAQLRKAHAINGGMNMGEEFVHRFVAKTLADDVEVSYSRGELVLGPRVSPKGGRTLDMKDVVDATKAWQDKLAPMFGGDGSNVVGMKPARDGNGYSVQITDGVAEIENASVFAGRAVRMPVFETKYDDLGTAVGHFQTGETIIKFPDDGTDRFVPEQLAGSGFAFVRMPSKQVQFSTDAEGNRKAELKDVYELRYIGETRDENNTRVLQEQAGVDPVTRAEDRFLDERSWLKKSTDNMVDYLISKGALDPTKAYSAVRRDIRTAEDAKAYLQDLIRLTRASVKDKDYADLGPDAAYREERRKLLLTAEGKRYRAYDDKTGRTIRDGAEVRGNPTIGVGFNMNRPDARKVFKEVLGIENFDDYYAGKEQLTEDQVGRLLDYNLEEFERIVDNKVKGAPLTRNQRLALVSMAFNGPKLLTDTLIEAIRDGRYDDAAAEIYRLAKDGNPALKGRRVAEARLFEGVLVG